jgi:hypothetical protein
MEDNAGTAARDFGITAGLTPVEAAELLGRLERGHQKAYQVAREFWRTPEWKTRKAMSEELDVQSVDALWAIYGSGIRQPGETLEEFTARARREAEPTEQTQLAGDMTQEQRDRAAEFSEGYRRGQGDAWNGTLEECGGTDERYEAGYAAGHNWGSAHPAPYGKVEASEVAEAAGADLPARPITDYLWSAGPVGEQEHETDDACVCGFSSVRTTGSTRSSPTPRIWRPARPACLTTGPGRRPSSTASTTGPLTLRTWMPASGPLRRPRLLTRRSPR